ATGGSRTQRRGTTSARQGRHGCGPGRAALRERRFGLLEGAASTTGVHTTHTTPVQRVERGTGHLAGDRTAPAQPAFRRTHPRSADARSQLAARYSEASRRSLLLFPDTRELSFSS